MLFIAVHFIAKHSFEKAELRMQRQTVWLGSGVVMTRRRDGGRGGDAGELRTYILVLMRLSNLGLHQLVSAGIRTNSSIRTDHLSCA